MSDVTECYLTGVILFILLSNFYTASPKQYLLIVSDVGEEKGTANDVVNNEHYESYDSDVDETGMTTE